MRMNKNIIWVIAGIILVALLIVPKVIEREATIGVQSSYTIGEKVEWAAVAQCGTSCAPCSASSELSGPLGTYGFSSKPLDFYFMGLPSNADSKWSFTIPDQSGAIGTWEITTTYSCLQNTPSPEIRTFTVAGCTEGYVRPCVSMGESGTQTCTNGVWASCVVITICTDTDDGRDYDEKGHTYISSGICLGGYCNEWDKCIGDTLYEYYCDGRYVKRTTIICSGECTDGACQEVIGCTNPSASEGEYACRYGDVDKCVDGDWDKMDDCNDYTGYDTPCIYSIGAARVRGTELGAADDCTTICEPTNGQSYCSGSNHLQWNYQDCEYDVVDCSALGLICENGVCVSAITEDWCLTVDKTSCYRTTTAECNSGELIYPTLAQCESNIEESEIVVISTTVQTDGSKIETQVVLKNIGLATAEDFLVEIQTIAGACNPLQIQAIISNPKICDIKHPQNIHRTISGLSAGEQITLNFETPNLCTDTYCVKALSTDECCPDGGCNPVAPFYWGENLKSIDVVSNIEATCGDGQCTCDEHYGNCQQDCTSYCGDTYCDLNTESGVEGAAGKLYCPLDCEPPIKDKKIWIVLGITGVAWLFLSKKGRKLMFRR